MLVCFLCCGYLLIFWADASVSVQPCPCVQVRCHQDAAACLQTRKYDWLLDHVWLRDEQFKESEQPVMRSELDAEAYELVPSADSFKHLDRLYTVSRPRSQGASSLEVYQGEHPAICD